MPTLPVVGDGPQWGVDTRRNVAKRVGIVSRCRLTTIRTTALACWESERTRSAGLLCERATRPTKNFVEKRIASAMCETVSV